MVQTLELPEVQIAEVESRPLTLRELGERLGIPIVVRKWWGSRREYTLDRGLQWYWACPGGYTFNQSKRPEIQKGVVVFWEGACGKMRHNHRQIVEVIDSGEHALLAHVSASGPGSRFLVGIDDGHPFVAPVPSRLKTVDEAFDWLVPKMVWESQLLGRDVKRQGDWFFIPYERPVRETRSRRFRVRPWRGTIRLGVEINVVYSQAPLVLGYGSVTRHIGERVIYRSYPQPLVKGIVTSPDHPPVVLESWHAAVRTRSTPSGNRDGAGGD